MIDREFFKDKSIAILGFGVEGKSTLNFLLANNFAFKKLSVLDANENLQVDAGVPLHSGEDYLAHLGEFDLIFKSPGIPYSPALQAYEDKIMTQMQFFFDHYPGKVIAVTASKGKSTIVSLLYAILKHVGYKVCLLGNIGTPVLDIIDFVSDWDFVIVELSSYMLTHLHKKNQISVLGSIFPEHMDWHGGLEKYIQAKLNILKGSEINVVLNKTLQDYQLATQYDNIISYGQGGTFDRSEGFFRHNLQSLFPTQERLLLGDHNLQNIAAAIAVTTQLGIDPQHIAQATRDFKGLPHRIELIGTYHEITFYDDAISTSPESTLEAINTFGSRIDTIFLGGQDRGYDFVQLAQKIQDCGIQNLVFFPETGHRISQLLQHYQSRVLHTDSMEDAVRFAYQVTTPGKIVLLSTASPSYSLWKNFEEKGSLFQEWVKKIASQDFSDGSLEEGL